MVTSALLISPIFYLGVYILKKRFGWFKDDKDSGKKEVADKEFSQVPNTDRSVNDHNRSFNDLRVD